MDEEVAFSFNSKSCEFEQFKFCHRNHNYKITGELRIIDREIDIYIYREREGGREGERREREGGRETETERQRERQRETERETKRDRERQRETERDKERGM